MAFEFNKGWMDTPKWNEAPTNYGAKDGSGKGKGRKGGGRRNINKGGCAEGGEGQGKGGGRGGGKNRTG